VDPHGSPAFVQTNSIHICPDERSGPEMCDTPYRSKGICRGSWEHLIKRGLGGLDFFINWKPMC
jgi:hypothetical protein